MAVTAACTAPGTIKPLSTDAAMTAVNCSMQVSGTGRLAAFALTKRLLRSVVVMLTVARTERALR